MPTVHEMVWLLRTGKADEDQKVAAACAIGKSQDSDLAKYLLPLLYDESSEARYYALQALVFDLQQVNEESAERCWDLLDKDPDEQVQSMAVACLGKIYFASRSVSVFCRLKEELMRRDRPMIVKASIYDALFEIMGVPPREWPSVAAVSESRWEFDESEIDWKRVAEFEREIRANEEDGPAGPER